MESLILKTSDGLAIAADYYEAPEGRRYALLLHMMPATKESWRTTALALRDLGFSSLAIDLRGHGQSDGGPKGYAEFSDAEHQQKIRDVEAAWTELKQRGATPENTAVFGASIGANLAIRILAQERLSAGVALSPGLDYHGVRTQDAARALVEPQDLLVIASAEDVFAYQTGETLSQGNDHVTFWGREDLGHGTSMFDNDSDLLKAAVDWVAEHV